MADVDKTLTRPAAAGEPADLLAAAWDAFSLLLAGCRDGEERSAELFAAFAFAAAAAAEGRLILDSAPSLPPGKCAQASDVLCVNADPYIAADDLAGLARALAARLSRAAREATGEGDREACGEAAGQAARIAGLLARDG